MLPYTEGREGQPQSDALSNRFWFGAETPRHRPETLAPTSEEDIAEENTLIAALADSPPSTRYASPLDPFVMGFILNPFGYLPPGAKKTDVYLRAPSVFRHHTGRRCVLPLRTLGDESKGAIRNE